MEGDFRTATLSGLETSRNLHYNFLASPIPFEYISNDSVTMGKEWTGPSPENKHYLPSWGYDPVMHHGQQFPGTFLPLQGNNSHTVHHYGFPQTWSHAVTQQNVNYNPHGGENYWFSECPLIDGFTSFEEGRESLEQDSRVTSSTEVSPWKPLQLVLPPVSELLNNTRGIGKCLYERSSSTEPFLEENCPLTQSMCKEYKQEVPGSGYYYSLGTKEAKTQTPWQLKKKRDFQPTSTEQLNVENKRPEKITNPSTSVQQKTSQREREKAIRDQLLELSKLLPWTDLPNIRPSRKVVLESAISHISQLQENIKDICHQKGIKMEDMGEESKEFCSPSTSDSCQDSTSLDTETSVGHSDELSIKSGDANVLPQEGVAVLSFSPSTEVSSPEFTEVEDTPSQMPTEQSTESKQNHIKRPMNAFLLFSQQYRKVFKLLHPGRDNRKISTLLAEQWRKLEPDEKQPYKEKAKELMRETKESHPDFKYCDTSTKKDGSVIQPACTRKQGATNLGYRIGSHNLRQRNDSKSKKKFAHEQSHKSKNTDKEKSSKAVRKTSQKGAKGTNKRMETKTAQVTNETKSPGKPAVKDEASENTKSHSRPKQGSADTGRKNIQWIQGTCDVWVQCENCRKWHMLPDNSDPTSLPDKWYCWMNGNSIDTPCSATEQCVKAALF